MDGQTVQSVVQGLKTVRDVARDANVDSNSIWCGGFFYTVNSQWLAEPAKIYTNLKTHISNNLSAKPLLPSPHPHIFGPDVLVDARDLAFLIDYQNSHNTPSAQVRGYSCDGASTSIFLSCLLEHLTNRLTGLHSPFADAVAELQVQQLEPPHVSFDL